VHTIFPPAARRGIIPDADGNDISACGRRA